ncbi:DUF4148 domain-containing protein [Burkholderia cenocepacia]|uniref:DUF4148 domain-containing protein n=1 Tax=Burkholderia cenocepacia TaxID=95486 RepID=UPI00222EEC7E|nr:DUF4148 domain-containing protein [Burkholderia cenocepacia]MCW3663688.1 DUF4148 domain-containing protein [Burkholderia cenocepacia]
MKSLIAALFVASTAMVPSLSFAQPTPGPTRAEVRAQLACAEQQGLMRLPKNSYPDKMSEMNCDSSGSGPSMNGNSQASAPMWQSSNPTLFRHH